jgi:hypothetical protein
MIFLAGCESTTELKYLGDDKATISKDIIKNSLGEQTLYIKEIEMGELAIGGFDSIQGYFLGVVIKIKNTGYEPITLTLDDITAKTEDNYKLKRINPDSYISAVLGRANRPTETNVNVYANQDQLSAGQKLGNAIENLGNTLSDQQVREGRENMKKYAQEVDVHALRQSVKIEPQSWDYYYVFFEKPRQYPVIISCQNLVYKLGR